jgi:ABC-type nitrate/sulfonate/bicarbonate transport system permease component
MLQSIRRPARFASRPQVDVLGIVGLLGLLVAWWIVTSLGLVPPLFLPPPGDVADAIATNFFQSPYLANYHLGDGGLGASLLYTIQNVLLALGIACVLGLGLGLTSARVAGLRAVFDPIVLTLGTIPVLVTAPFFLIWFGTERAPQVALLTLYDTTIIYMFAQRAVGNLDPIYQDAARTLGASPRRMLVQVFLVGTLPEVFGGVRIALAGAWGLEAVAELLGAPAGIGRVIQALASATDVPTIMAAILALAMVAVAFDAAVAGLFGVITRWRMPNRI